MADDRGTMDPWEPENATSNDLGPEVLEDLIVGFYDEWRRLAQSRLARGANGHLKLTATEQVHEAYLRIVKNKLYRFEGRRHFLFVVSRAMSDVLAEKARSQGSYKRGGGYLHIDLEHASSKAQDPRDDVLALNQALAKLEAQYPDRAWVVQLRYFEGLTVQEASEVLECSEATVKRRWAFALAWLKRELAAIPPESQVQPR